MRISTAGTRLTDERGRERIFGGVNMVHKDPASGYAQPFTREHYRYLASAGLDLVRLGVIWDGLEPEPGVFSESYLSELARQLDWADEFGIGVYLDMHQDLYSSQFGDGAPAWATLTDGAEYSAGEFWSDAYLFDPAVQNAYSNFWKNTEVDGVGLQDHLAKAWAELDRRFGHHPAVIGFDWLNEPFPAGSQMEVFGTLLGAYIQITADARSIEELAADFSDPQGKQELLANIDDPQLYAAMAAAAAEPAEAFDSGVLGPFQAKLTTAAPDKLSVCEASYFSNMGIESAIPKQERMVYSPHGYDLTVDTEAIQQASDNRLDVIWAAHLRTQQRLDVPVIVGEWGAQYGYAGGLEHIAHQLDTFDKNHWSHTYWCFEPGFENLPAASVLKRPHPQAVAGEIDTYSWDSTTGEFSASWASNMNEESVFYLPSAPQKVDGNVKTSTELVLDGCRLHVQAGEDHIEVKVQL
ncbi:MAG: cellulase family glycosylhydrolase [Propionibacteriaceae bacterium]|jgi:endoglycosylceramidase|nr:cellulase family glycosylhydrolase [Propionibacteriaceae bacterium]